MVLWVACVHLCLRMYVCILVWYMSPADNPVPSFLRRRQSRLTVLFQGPAEDLQGA